METVPHQAAYMAYCYRANWHCVFNGVVSLDLLPATAWCWKDPVVGNAWIIQGNRDATEFLQFVRERISDQVWEQAASHYCGTGATNGGIVPGTVERFLRVQQRKSQWEAYGMTIATISAGI